MENTEWNTKVDVTPLDKEESRTEEVTRNNLMGLLPMFILIAIVLLRISYVLYRSSVGQKTRSQQQRRVVRGEPRGRPSLQVEPTIYLSPNNLPAPPKYEALAPPSYEEVMAVTYPAYPGAQPQPITYPITHAIAQTSQNVQPSPHNTSRNEEASPSTVITVTAEDRRTSVTVATS